MLIVPLQAVANQTLNILLANQSCDIAVYQKSTGLYFNLAINGAAIVNGVICENQNLLVRSSYLGVIGDFWFFDTQGTSDPEYLNLGTRYQLQYLEAADFAAARAAA